MKKRYCFLANATTCLLAASVLFGCAKKPSEDKGPSAENPRITISGKPADMAKYYNAPEFLECYRTPIAPPALDLGVDLSTKSLQELRLLRNEIYARHGYLFMDMVLRGYFVQYNWYQPIYWDSLYKVTLSRDEAAYIDKIHSLEEEHLKMNYVELSGRKMSNYDNVVNTVQFKVIPDTLASLLRRNGFALVKSDRQQLFHVYDENQYEAIPHYVTVDLYLQLMHVYYSNLLRRIEIDKLVPALKEGLANLQSQAVELYSKCRANNSILVDAARFNAIYYSVAKAALEGSADNLPSELQKEFEEEIARVHSRNGRGSSFLKSDLFDYSQLQPRGYYAGDSTLSAYFVCFRWLELAPMFISDDDGLASAIVGAYLLKQGNGRVMPQYAAIDGVASILVGEPNNLSLNDAIPFLEGTNTPVELSSLLVPDKLGGLKKKLVSLNSARIVNRAASELAEKELQKVPLHFMSARYTFDGEILYGAKDRLDY